MNDPLAHHRVRRTVGERIGGIDVVGLLVGFAFFGAAYLVAELWL